MDQQQVVLRFGRFILLWCKYSCLSLVGFCCAKILSAALIRTDFICCFISFISFIAGRMQTNTRTVCVAHFFPSFVYYGNCTHVVWFPDLERIGHNRKEKSTHTHTHTHAHTYSDSIIMCFVQFVHLSPYAISLLLLLLLIFCISFVLLLLLL